MKMTNLTADERLALVRLKIERADKHIMDLQTEIRNFIDSNPYEVASKRNPQTRQLIYYVARADPIPNTFAAITGDVLNNLRNSSDHLAQQLYLVGTGGAKGYRDQTSFLIAETAKKFKAGLPGKLEGMRQDAIKEIRALEPCQGGQGADLWAFHRLNNIDKHRLIVTVGSSFRSVGVGSLLRRTFGAKFPKSIVFSELFIKPADIVFPQGRR